MTKISKMHARLNAKQTKQIFSTNIDQFISDVEEELEEEMIEFNKTASNNVDLELCMEPVYKQVIKNTFLGGTFKVAFFHKLEKASGHPLSFVDIICQITNTKNGKSIIKGFNNIKDSFVGKAPEMPDYMQAGALWMIECDSMIVHELMKDCFIGNREFYKTVD